MRPSGTSTRPSRTRASAGASRDVVAAPADAATGWPAATPHSVFISVVLPAPLAPSSAVAPPSSTCSSMPWRMRVGAVAADQVRRPRAAARSCVRSEVDRQHHRISADLGRRAGGDQFAVVQHDDAGAQLHQGAHDVLDHQQRQAARACAGGRSVSSICATSVGVRPAMTSSSSTSRAPVAIARAISRRFCPESVSVAAGRPATIGEAELVEDRQRWRIGRAGVAKGGVAEQAPRCAGSRARSAPAKGLTIWNVRAMPSRQTRSGDRPTMARAFELDPAARGPGVAGDQAEERRLAGAIGAHDADGLAFGDLEAHVLQRAQPAEALAEAAHGEQGASSRLLVGAAAQRRGPPRRSRRPGDTIEQADDPVGQQAARS